MKTQERIDAERDTLALLVIGGFFIPPVWLFALFMWLGGGGRQER